MRVKLDNDLEAIYRAHGMPGDEYFEINTDSSGSIQKICLAITAERGDDEWNQELYSWIHEKVCDLHSELIGKLTERLKEINEASIKEQGLDPSRLP